MDENSLHADPHYAIGRVRGILHMMDEPNLAIYRMTPEKAIEILREIFAEYDAAKAGAA